MEYKLRLNETSLSVTKELSSDIICEKYHCSLVSLLDSLKMDYQINCFFEFCNMLKAHKEYLCATHRNSQRSLPDKLMGDEELKVLWLNVLVEECLNYYKFAGTSDDLAPKEVCRVVDGIREMELGAFEASGLLSFSDVDSGWVKQFTRIQLNRSDERTTRQMDVLSKYVLILDAFIHRNPLMIREEIRKTHKDLRLDLIPRDMLLVGNRRRLSALDIARQDDAPNESEKEKSQESSVFVAHPNAKDLHFNVKVECWIKGVVQVCIRIRSFRQKSGKYGVEGPLRSYADWILEWFPLVGEMYTCEQLIKVLGKSQPYSTKVLGKILGEEDKEEFLR